MHRASPILLRRLERRGSRRREHRSRATVSLTFDDARASQRVAAALLEEHGLTATYYVSSALVGEHGRLDWDDLRRLAEAGHEIGGHTRSHVHLRDVSDEEAEREIVADREELVARGFAARTFAYPFGEHDERSRNLVMAAGYAGARGVGGVLEAVPPADPFVLRTPHSARAHTGVDDLAAFVRVAEHEGGWMILVLHHLGDGQGSDYATSVSTLERFLSWLTTQDVAVRRVCDVLDAMRQGAAPSR